MLIDELSNLSSTKELVTFELDDSDSTELTGFILSVNLDLVLLYLVNEDGSGDGYTLFEHSLISEMYWGNREHNIIKKLSQDRANVLPIELKAQIMSEAIAELAQKYKAIGLFSYGDGDRFEAATVLAQDDTWLKLSCFGTKKTLSKLNKMIKIENIIRIEFGSPYISDLIRMHSTSVE